MKADQITNALTPIDECETEFQDIIMTDSVSSEQVQTEENIKNYVNDTSRISLTEDALKELRENVKRVLEVIVGLLKDRIVGSEEPAVISIYTMYPGQSPELLYLFFACINKKYFFLAKNRDKMSRSELRC